MHDQGVTHSEPKLKVWLMRLIVSPRLQAALFTPVPPLSSIH